MPEGNSPPALRGRKDFVAGTRSYLDGTIPPTALALPVRTVVTLLSERSGHDLDALLRRWSPGTSVPALGGNHESHSPLRPDTTDPAWIRSTRMVGINVRTVGSFWRVVHYLLTVPSVYDSVHLLPIWEPGVVGSLYGMASWELNAEFVDHDLARTYPNIADAESQLELTVALIHASGRTAGLDVIPHTDRFSEIVLAQPHYFEWLRRKGTEITAHEASLHEAVMDEIYGFLSENGHAGDDASTVTERAAFFTAAVSEAERNRALFGERNDPEGRRARRDAIIDRLYALGYEPVPATMAPPYRGLGVDPDESYVDDAGRRWYEYAITRPQSMSRVFGPLARYKFYERKDDNREWQIDFERPREAVFDYFAGHITDLQRRYGFDFMRGDMSHVQMRPEGVPLNPDRFYDPLAYVKSAVARTRPSFAYFAETFLAPPNVMAYGDEIDHLEASSAEVTLGDLQSAAPGDETFLPTLRRYLDIAATRGVTPSFTVMTGDKDDPRFDRFYSAGNEARMFVSLFLPSLPSYTALGFELRDRHDEPAANEYYSKLYVFHEESGPKSTRGPYRFGENTALFERLNRIRGFADRFAPLRGPDRGRANDVQWALLPDATAGNRMIAWWLADATANYLCVVNTDSAAERRNLRVVLPRVTPTPPQASLLFSTEPASTPRVEVGRHALRISVFDAGEAQIYSVQRTQ